MNCGRSKISRLRIMDQQTIQNDRGGDTKSIIPHGALEAVFSFASIKWIPSSKR